MVTGQEAIEAIREKVAVMLKFWPEDAKPIAQRGSIVDVTDSRLHHRWGGGYCSYSLVVCRLLAGQLNT